MNLQKTTLTFFVLCFGFFTGFSQEKALSKIDTADLKQHLIFISSDELQGRKLGTEVDGLGITADYIAENCKRIGLEPGAENYFQQVNLITTKPNKNSFIEIVNKKENVEYTAHEFINLSGGANNLHLKNEEVVLVGFGTKDLEDSNLENKIIIVAQGNFETYKEGTEFRWNNRIERAKIKTLSAKKPKAIIFVSNPKDKKNSTFSQISSWYSRERTQLESSGDIADDVPILVVLPEFADQLFGHKDKYKKYLNAITDENDSETVLLEKKKINLNYRVSKKEISVKNVIGIVEGSDPELKNEAVVFMAHYDHLGIGEDGDVYNGADDNGSGTVAIMEVAEAFSSLETKPKRSIVFLWVTCEEIGMFGSNYYSQHPVFPMEKTVACVNLDMVGRVFEERDTVWNRSPKKVKDYDGLFTLSNEVWPELAEINNRRCKELGLVPDTTLPANFLRSSDHYNFHKNGVPILNFATGYHADYHKVGDEVSKINFEKMKRVADLCFLVGMDVANRENIVHKRPE